MAPIKIAINGCGRIERRITNDGCFDGMHLPTRRDRTHWNTLIVCQAENGVKRCSRTTVITFSHRW
eukprot:gene7408-536_t